MQLTLNIGLDTNTGGLLACAFVRHTLEQRGFCVEAYSVHQSDTERTLVAQVDYQRPAHMLAYDVKALAFYLQQDCIAVHADGIAALYGPKPWGAFNPAFFLTLEGERLVDTLTV